MEKYEGILDIETDKITSDIESTKEQVRVNNIINKVKLYENNKDELTKMLTDILMDDNVSEILVKLSREKIFVKLFPEFYIKNEYGEDVINCQQNSLYHKYGVLVHILHTIEAVGNPQIPVGDWQKKILKWTMLLHDIGKPYVKKIYEDGTESFAGHEDVSFELSKDILNRFTFNEDEKQIILTLIKYHDKYLNEGELTYDNMKFLASELNNNKELFYLLIDVKDADAKSKSIDVYNKYKFTKNKYLEFVNSYFASGGIEQGNLLDDVEIIGESQENIESKDEEISKIEMNNLIDSIIDKKNILNVYQPVVDIHLKNVYGYELLTRINSLKNIDIVKVLNYSLEIDKYDKIQQILFVNGIDNFDGIGNKESNILFINTDITSYEKYINKPRIYDMMMKMKLVISFNNYEKRQITDVQEIINTIHSHKGLVALDNFGIGNLSIDDLNILDIDYIIPDISIIKEILNNSQKQKYISDLVTYCISRNINLLVVGVEDRQTLNILKKLGVRYVQGFYFEKPSQAINMLNDKIEKLLEDGDESIT